MELTKILDNVSPDMLSQYRSGPSLRYDGKPPLTLR